MDNLPAIFICITPIVSPLVWAMIMLLAVKDSIGQLEKRIKTVLVFYFLSVALNWILLALYTYYPESAPYTNSLMLFSFLATAVTFYHFVYLLTITRIDESFPVWHYAAPLLITAALQVWSLFVPADVQVELYRGRGAVVPEYEAYSRFFLSKPYLRALFSGIYTFMAVVRLRRYYCGQKFIGKPRRWFLRLIALSIALFVIAVAASMVDRGNFYFAASIIISCILMIALHITIGYNVIRRNFLLYIPMHLTEDADKTTVKRESPPPAGRQDEVVATAKRRYRRHTEVRLTERGKIEYAKLTKAVFESYFKKHRPYLDPQLKITDLLEPLRTNRTILSGFVNKTYGVNFNRYINRCRLKEVERLRGLSSNAGKDIFDLIEKAGFAKRRNYSRALEAERGTDNNNPKQP